MLTAESAERIEMVVTGDTSNSLHVLTPSCNALTAAPELVYTFTVAEGAVYGYDIRSTGYDTVLQVYKGSCSKETVVACADDATPPGDLGSRVAGSADAGTYYVMVDGYSSADFGPFELALVFVRDCVPLCDGNFCGSDSCGGICGTCGEGASCNSVDFRCYPENCEPQCGERECGEDGCGKIGGLVEIQNKKNTPEDEIHFHLPQSFSPQHYQAAPAARAVMASFVLATALPRRKRASPFPHPAVSASRLATTPAPCVKVAVTMINSVPVTAIATPL